MITVIEPVCKKWEHEEVNAGLLRLVDQCLPNDEKITFHGENRHVEAVSTLYNSENIKFSGNKIESRFDETQDYVKAMIYLYRCIRNDKSDVVFVSAAYHPFILAVKKTAFFCKNTRFYVVLHSMVEEKYGQQLAYDDLVKAEAKNVFFITYSKNCYVRYREMGVKNIIFLHHPYIEARTEHKNKNKDRLNIGIIGACANNNAERLISRIRRDKNLDRVEFFIMSSNSNQFRAYKGCSLNLNFSRSSIEEFMDNIDYLLLPYGKSDYELSASGVLWDAVSNKLPCLCYDSDYLKYYQNIINIGYVKESLDEMYNLICDLLHTDGVAPRRFEKLKTMDRENIDNMKKILRR